MGSLHLETEKCEECFIDAVLSLLPKRKLVNREPKLSHGSLKLTHHLMKGWYYAHKLVPWPHFQYLFEVHMQIKYQKGKKSKIC